MDDEELVEPQDQNWRNSPKVTEEDAGPRAAPDTLGIHEPCYWNDKKYSDGVCESHIR
jgi:hypothetical protein